MNLKNSFLIKYTKKKFLYLKFFSWYDTIIKKVTVLFTNRVGKYIHFFSKKCWSYFKSKLQTCVSSDKWLEFTPWEWLPCISKYIYLLRTRVVARQNVTLSAGRATVTHDYTPHFVPFLRSKFGLIYMSIIALIVNSHNITIYQYIFIYMYIIT